MDKLVERQPVSRGPLATAPALAVQFFLIPLSVVAVTAAIYVGFRSLLADDRTAQDYLIEIRTGGDNRRWPAAYELSRLMADPAVRAADRTLVPGLVQAFGESKSGDPRVRRYLALALGRIDAPAPPEAVQLLTEALDDADSDARISAIWALGSLGEASAVPRLEQNYASDDAGIRKMIVYALGAIPEGRSSKVLETALNDPAADVQWNAAIALARHGRREGVPVLRRMLDRPFVESRVEGRVEADADMDPAGEVMISGLQAAAALREPLLRDPVAAIGRHDKSLKVRQAALEALKAYGR
ncbi:MAG: HEAT repeat domain-containing protein [Vicinamibacterales bacterium]